MKNRISIYLKAKLDQADGMAIEPILSNAEGLEIIAALEATRPEARRVEVIEECAKIIDRKGQALTDEYCHGDAGPDGYTWTNKEAEWQVILLGELADEFRALKATPSPQLIPTEKP